MAEIDRRGAGGFERGFKRGYIPDVKFTAGPKSTICVHWAMTKTVKMPVALHRG